MDINCCSKEIIDKIGDIDDITIHKLVVEGFIVGHKYIYLGVTRPENWVTKMDFALLPQVLTCDKVDNLGGHYCHFIEDKNCNTWWWSDEDNSLEGWMDVTDIDKELIRDILEDKRKRAMATKI